MSKIIPTAPFSCDPAAVPTKQKRMTSLRETICSTVLTAVVPSSNSSYASGASSAFYNASCFRISAKNSNFPKRSASLRNSPTEIAETFFAGPGNFENKANLHGTKRTRGRSGENVQKGKWGGEFPERRRGRGQRRKGDTISRRIDRDNRDTTTATTTTTRKGRRWRRRKKSAMSERA